MLTEHEIKEIEKEIALYPVKSAACIEALKIVQQHRGWVPDEQIKDIAELLDMSYEEVDGVATFYNMIFRKPVGRNVIYVCNSVTCYMMGYESIYQTLSKKLGIKWGETTPDGRFTLLPNPCLGDCDHAPAMMVNHDHYNRLTPEKLDEILEKYK
ncbi:MAG: NADH-quinone oxidoreductase subunit NuoE [Bacteroidales bacterium]|nr:NADH-quinone oxidoreductase subunit NuoE [Bacteroidales bacterium]HOK98645.1 NADH-quinone oxidoreductase subunit NuoE [Bacteroidales bacterium]HPO65558.1 NADH-quinone oxidoreductase subunit NuoE [Bacteroidales bacterium]